MKQIATEAVLLKRINYGEADRILTVLTKDKGQVSMLAKGVRKSKSKLAGGLELFSVTDINYIDGKSNIKTIISTRLKDYYKNIVTEVDRTMAGYDYMKAIASFSEHSDDPVYFNLLVGGLESLNNTNLPVSLIGTWFYTKLLQVHGNGVNLEKPLDAKSFSESSNYSFSFEDMSFFENASGNFIPNHIKFLRLVEKSNYPKQLASVNGYEHLSEDLQTTIKQAATMHKA
jgi:DNA repair protein RecO (recombination protein O)